MNDRRSEYVEASKSFRGTQMPYGEQAELARVIAEAAHQGQADKLGNEYIAHPRRVANRIRALTHPVEYCAAWLHDVLEDTAITADDLRRFGVAEDVIEVVELLTRDKDDQDSDAYYRRISGDDRAFMVKLADIADNLDPARTSLLPHDVRMRLLAKYQHALEVLGTPGFWLWRGERYPNTAEGWAELRGSGNDGDKWVSAEDAREFEAYMAWVASQCAAPHGRGGEISSDKH